MWLSTQQQQQQNTKQNKEKITQSRKTTKTNFRKA